MTFEHGRPLDRFDFVVGADGLHSHRPPVGLRRTRTQFRRLHSAATWPSTPSPTTCRLQGRMLAWNLTPGRLAATYPVTARPDRPEPRSCSAATRSSTIDHRDLDRPASDYCTRSYAADGWEVPRLLAEMDDCRPTSTSTRSARSSWTSWVRRSGHPRRRRRRTPPARPSAAAPASPSIGAYILADALRHAGATRTQAFDRYERDARARHPEPPRSAPPP